MGALTKIHKLVVAAAVIVFGVILPIHAAARPVPELLAELQAAEDVTSADRIVRALRLEWDKSGSATMDLLLKRGREALEAKNFTEATEHFTALTDHAPGFAEGWYGRATAYFHAGLYGPAVADLERALSLNPDHFEAIRGLAVILEQLDRYEDAYEAYSHVLALHPHHQDAMEAVQRIEQRVKGQQL